MFKVLSILAVGLGLNTGLYAQEASRAGNPEIYSNGKRIEGMLDRYLSRSMMLALFTDHVERPGYSNQLKMIRKLKPAYLSRIAGSWGLPETELLPQGKLYDRTKKVINDIRAMYSEDGAAMPMIEGGIFEAITTDVNRIPIPDWVLLAFTDDPEIRHIKYSRRKSVYFNADSMRNTGRTDWSAYTRVPDIDRIHTRLWFYYLSTIFIDMGCNSIHFGWFELITEHDSLYLKTEKLFQKIRGYAKRKNNFVIFNADIDRILYVNNTQRLLLDFLSSPIRPEATLNSFKHSPCEGQPMTELNIAKYCRGLIEQNGGITADGDTVKSIPVLFNLDWYGIGYKGKQPGQMGLGDGGWAPWAVNETIWLFSLDDECQAYWLKNISAAIKNNIIDRGYVKIPAVQPLTWWGYPVTEYLLVRNKKLLADIEDDMWKVNTEPFFTITFFPATAAHILNVSNPDMTSIYSWHIKHTDTGRELPEAFGTRYALRDLLPGKYRVTLRQDNAMFAGKQEAQFLIKELVVE